MSTEHTIASLGTLVRMRTSELERLQAELASQEALRTRYRANLERLAELTAASGASGALAPALALNCGSYKQSVIALTDTHRTDLGLHEATMARGQQALNAAWARRELLGQVLEHQRGQAAAAADARDRKRQDELATQSWLANRNKL